MGAEAEDAQNGVRIFGRLGAESRRCVATELGEEEQQKQDETRGGEGQSRPKWTRVTGVGAPLRTRMSDGQNKDRRCNGARRASLKTPARLAALRERVGGGQAGGGEGR